MDPSRGYERRIGGRRQIDPVEVALVWEHRERTGRFGRYETHVERVAGTMVDVSVSGAAVETAGLPEPRPGWRLVLEVGVWRAVVVIRRVSPAEGDALRLGVEFVELDDALQEYLHRLIGRDRPRGLQEFWERAR